MIESVRARLDRWEVAGLIHPTLAAAWRSILDESIENVVSRLTATDEKMNQLRSVSPFAGELAPRDRWQIWREVREGITG